MADHALVSLLIFVQPQGVFNTLDVIVIDVGIKNKCPHIGPFNRGDKGLHIHRYLCIGVVFIRLCPFQVHCLHFIQKIHKLCIAVRDCKPKLLKGRLIVDDAVNIYRPGKKIQAAVLIDTIRYCGKIEVIDKLLPGQIVEFICDDFIIHIGQALVKINVRLQIILHFFCNDIIRSTDKLICHNVNIGEFLFQHRFQIQIHSAAQILHLDLDFAVITFGRTLASAASQHCCSKNQSRQQTYKFFHLSSPCRFF